jgi:hypothetical protein
MRLFSTAALSLALAAGASLALPQAAMAQSKKEREAAKAAAAAKPTVSPKFFKGAKAVQDLLTAKDYDGALAAIPEAETTASTPDDQYFLGNFYLNIGLGKNDLAIQRKGLELMLASGKVAPEERGKIALAAGSMAANAKDLEGARAHFATALAAGADPAETEALIAESYFGPAYATVVDNAFTAEGRGLAVQGLPHLRKAIDTQVAKGVTPALNWYERGLQTAIVANAPDALEWAKLTLAQTDKPQTWRMALRLLQEKNEGMARPVSIDLLRLMQSAKAMGGDYSYSELVEALWRSGLPGEVKGVIDSGVASGEIQQARFSELYKLASDSIPKDKASLPASEKSAEAAANGKLASSAADGYMSYGEYAKAVPLYRAALTKGGVDADEVNTRLGIALARSGDFQGAKTAFSAVAGAGARKEIAELWAIWAGRQVKA